MLVVFRGKKRAVTLHLMTRPIYCVSIAGYYRSMTQTLFELVLTAKTRLKMSLCVENPTLGSDKHLVWATHSVSAEQRADSTE